MTADQAIATTLAVAWRHFDDATTTEAERDALLVTISHLTSGEQGEHAARMLHHRIEARRAQLLLTGLLTPPPQATRAA